MNVSSVKTPVEIWTEGANYWERHAPIIRQMFQPITEALADSADLRSTDHVLDIAAGTGEPSLSLAERRVTSGWVCCTDIIGQMVLVAKREATKRALERVSFVRCSAESLPFDERVFDAAVCRLGIMFVSDPLASIKEALRTIKPGGRLAYAVWHRPDANPFFNIATRALERYVRLPPFDPDAPSAFRFAEPSRLRGLMEAAGIIRVREIPKHFEIEAAIDVDELWTLRSELSEMLRSQRGKLPPEKFGQVASDFKRMAQPFFSSGQLKLPAEVLVVSGMNPG